MTPGHTSPDRPTELACEEPLGARPLPGGGFEVRVWAPRATEVALVLEAGAAHGSDVTVAADTEGDGVWCARSAQAEHAQRYRIRLDGVDHGDPWSRHQPDGLLGAPALLDPAAIGAVDPARGTRPARPRHALDEAVIYELHVGCFSAEGTFAGVEAHLEGLATLGITHLELMPVHQFPGHHGWGYDGILWSAAHHAYGGPEALVHLIDAAHAAGLGVVLDVVYNHIGPTGDQTYDAYGPFFTDRHRTPWGSAVNVDGPGSSAVRATIVQNAQWWLGEVGVDGLRVDACHAIVDQSARPIFAELTDAARAVHPEAVLIAESGLNDPRTIRPPAQGGWGFDADWADDFHHALRTLLTTDRQGWYADFGSVAQLAKAFHRPYVHDGTWSSYRQRRFGAPAGDREPGQFVVFDQNHDQVGNRPLGDRLPAETRPLAALCTLLSAFTPMLFMGEEYGEDAPFQFFSDHQDDFIADATRDGRRREFADFTAATGEAVPDPQDRATFERSKLTRRRIPEVVELYRRLLALRPRIPRGPVTTTVDEDRQILTVTNQDWTLVANFSTVSVEVTRPPGVVQVATYPGATRVVTATDPSVRLPAQAGVLLHADPAAASTPPAASR